MDKKTSYTHCLNCQTELHGKYCHVCGQHATSSRPTVKEFFLEYLNIEFIWDSRFLKTISQILSKPGFVTKEYVSGKFVSYTHPLKLNMFLLFIFISLVLLFSKGLGTSIQSVTRDETNYSMISLQVLSDDEAYSELLYSSKLDTVQLYAPLILADAFPDLVTALDVDDTVNRDSLSVWTAVLPHILIEDEVIIKNAEYYSFQIGKDNTGVMGTDLLESTWSQMVSLVTKYFPVIILLTVPFLAFIIRLVHRKSGHSAFSHLIFSLHYTAFLGMLTIIMYLINLIVSPPGSFLLLALILGSCIYMLLAIRRFYETKTWFSALIRSIIINSGYALVLSALIFILVIISVTIVVINM